MNFKDFDFVAVKEKSEHVADLLKRAGLRIQQRVITENGRRPVYVIAVHPDDMDRAEEVQSEAMRRECEDFTRTLQFVLQPYADKDMLIACEPNEAGYFGSAPYHGEPFDQAKLRLVRGGWDHEHCYICYAKVESGDEWWVAQPPDHDNEIGLCLDCHIRLFGADSA